MSKYIKLDDAIHNINLEVTGRKEYTGDMKANLFFALDDLPTIEVSEDDLYIPLNNHTVERINRLYKDECGEYFDEEWLFSELEQIAEFRTVSEDAISRAKLKADLKAWTTNLGNPKTLVRDDVFAVIDTETSVMPKPKEGEWIDMGDFEKCSACKATHLKEFQSYYGKAIWTKTPYCPYCGAKMRLE